jgi:hypothetical protein
MAPDCLAVVCKCAGPEGERPFDFLSRIPLTIMAEQATKTRASVSVSTIRVWLHSRETICSHEDGIHGRSRI